MLFFFTIGRISFIGIDIKCAIEFTVLPLNVVILLFREVLLYMSFIYFIPFFQYY